MVTEIRAGHMNLEPVCIGLRPLISLLNILVLWLVLYRKSWSLWHCLSSLLSVSVERIYSECLSDMICSEKGLSLKENSKILYFALQYDFVICLVVFLFETGPQSFIQAGLQSISPCWPTTHRTLLGLSLSGTGGVCVCVCVCHLAWFQEWI